MGEPKYVVTLDPSNIKKIREDNKKIDYKKLNTSSYNRLINILGNSFQKNF